MEKIRLKSITCHQPSEKDKDEIFLKLLGDKIWPTSSKFTRIDSDQTVDINLTIEAKTMWVEIELWEYDYLSKNDHLGDFVFKSRNYPGEYSSELKVMDNFDGKVAYTLHWEVVSSYLR